MRRTITLAAIASVVVLAACIGDRVPTEQSPSMGPKAPQFDHVGGTVQTVVVDVNNYVLSLQPDRLWNAVYKGTGVLFAGELSYGNAPDAVFFYDAFGGRALPRLQGTVLPIEVAAGPFADHQTVSLLIEKTAGASLPLGLIAVRETFGFRNAPDEDYVILKYTLFNASPDPVEGLHVGQILDIDVGVATSNVVEYDPAGDFVRVLPPSATPVAGHALLQLPATSYRASTNPLVFGLTPADPRTTGEAFDFLSGGIVNPGPFGPSDVRHTLSHGPVSLGGDEAEVFAFALAAGDDPADLANNIVAARARYRALPKGARRPYPVIAVKVTIEPWPVDPATHTEFTATLRGVPRKLVPLFDQSRTYCGVPPLPSSPATTVTVLRNGIRATFPITNLPPTGLGPGDEIVCAGRLTDGTLLVGRPDPTPLPVAPATQLTAVGVNRAPTWSPDGSAIAFSSDRSGTVAIWRMSVEAGEASAVRLTDGPDDQSPDWFGSTIAFGRGGATLAAGEIYTVFDAGDGVTLINADGRNPRYSPDGATLAFVRVTDNRDVWTMAAAGGGEAQITSGDLEFHPEWSPDGSEIYFTAFDGQGAVFKVAASGGAAVRVTPDEGTDNRHPAVSPDGHWLAFTSGQACPSIVLQELATGHHTVVPLDPAVCARPVASAEVNQNLEFSPDGKRILFASDGQIWVADLSAVIP